MESHVLRVNGQETSTAEFTRSVGAPRAPGTRDRPTGDVATWGRPGDDGADAAPAEDTGVIVTFSPAARQRAAGAGDKLTDQQSRRVEELRGRDAEVRAHESAHVAASGGLGGSPSFEYAVGPDGQRYVVGGEVSIDTSSGRTPEETIAKARTIRAAATAPADPSSQDMAVAAAAARMEAEAQQVLQARRQSEKPRESAPAPPTDRPSAVGKTAAGGDRSDPVGEAADMGDTVERKIPGAAEEHEAGMVLATLVREQIAMRGGGGHSHLEMDCGFCRKAVGRYG